MKQIDLIIDALEKATWTSYSYDDADICKQALAAARELKALAQHEPPPSYEYAEIRIRVGDLHIKRAITPDQFLEAHDPFKLLSLLANECIQNIKEQA